jgi:hypothetical protein
MILGVVVIPSDEQKVRAEELGWTIFGANLFTAINFS